MKWIAKTLLELFAYMVAIITVAMVTGRLIKLLLGPAGGHPELLRFMITGAIILFSVAVVHWIMRHRGWTAFSEAGWPRGVGFLRSLGVGALIGLGMIVTTEGLLLLSGFGHFIGAEGGLRDYLALLLPLFFGIGLLAFAEEVVFRGYPLAKLASLIGPAWANVILSLLFALVHLGNEGTGILVMVNIFLGSLAIGLVRFTRWGVPAAGGFHVAWNLFQVLIGATVSGETLPVPVVRLVTSGPNLLTGGDFGPEGSVWATIATLLVLALLFRFGRRLDIENALPTPRHLLGRRV